MVLHPNHLSPEEYERLAKWLESNATQARVSSESLHQILTDRFGCRHDIGGRLYDVILPPDNIPRIVGEEHARILDCGHAITSLKEILGVCDYGHILCYREKLYRCAKCGRFICKLDIIEIEGALFCPDCCKPPVFLIALICIIIAIIALIILPGR
jgi:hypothetical protein